MEHLGRFFGRTSDAVETGLAFVEAWWKRAGEHREPLNRVKWYWWVLLIVAVALTVGLLSGRTVGAVISNLLAVSLLYLAVYGIRLLASRKRRRAG